MRCRDEAQPLSDFRGILAVLQLQTRDNAAGEAKVRSRKEEVLPTEFALP